MTICERCGKRHGIVFTFYYGKKEKEETLPGRHANEVVKKTAYSVGGEENVVLCNLCITKDWLKHIVLLQPSPQQAPGLHT